MFFYLNSSSVQLIFLIIANIHINIPRYIHTHIHTHKHTYKHSFYYFETVFFKFSFNPTSYFQTSFNCLLIFGLFSNYSNSTFPNSSTFQATFHRQHALQHIPSSPSLKSSRIHSPLSN